MKCIQCGFLCLTQKQLWEEPPRAFWASLWNGARRPLTLSTQGALLSRSLQDLPLSPPDQMQAGLSCSPKGAPWPGPAALHLTAPPSPAWLPPTARMLLPSLVTNTPLRGHHHATGRAQMTHNRIRKGHPSAAESRLLLLCSPWAEGTSPKPWPRAVSTSHAWVSGASLCCSPCCDKVGTEAGWPQPRHSGPRKPIYSPLRSRGSFLLTKMSRGLCKIPQIHPKPTPPTPTHTHTHTLSWGLYLHTPTLRRKGREVPGQQH